MDGRSISAQLLLPTLYADANVTMSPLRVAFVAEQLLEPEPGPIGAYARALMRRLPPTGVALEPVVAWHRSSALSDAGVPHARRLRLPRGSLYRRWMNGRPPAPGGDAELVHAPSLAFPPSDGRPLVVTVHDTLFIEDPEGFPPAALEFNRAMVERLPEVETVIVPSRATGNALAALDRPPKRIRVVPMGTNVKAPEPSERDAVLERLDIEPPYVLWTGTLDPRRNPEGVVRGFVHALESGVPEAEKLNLYISSPPGWWSTDIAKLLDEKGFTGRVRRVGAQPPPVRAALYAGASAFLFPSHAEGFPTPVVEAMACGAPVVASNRSSIPEVTGAAAELCDPTDPVAIGQALSKVLRDADFAADLRRLGLRRAQDFSWEKAARETLGCYREALGDGGDTAAASSAS